MELTFIEKSLDQYEQKLVAQERYRQLLGVKEVECPTYQRYITGKIERFDRRRNAFAALKPDNPWGEEFRNRFEKKTGVKAQQPLPQEELDQTGRAGQALGQALWRICRDYKPEVKSMSSAAGRLEVDDPAAMSRLIKKVAMLCGAEMVRITEIDPRWTYKDHDIPHKYAIICAVPHFSPFTATAPSFLSGAAVGEVYSRLNVITTQLADFISLLGYPAQYRETKGPTPELLMVPLAIDAGIGEFARNGRCLSPEFGINMRLKAVTTDLPLKPDKPISFGTHDFCMVCESCAKFCPVNAIPYGEPTDPPEDMLHHNPGYRKWWIKAGKCLTFWMHDRKRWTSCGGRCIAVCPWNKPKNWFHNVIRWTAIHAPKTIKKLLVWADEVTYYRTKKINS
jgi:reductive dehalogenase